MSEFRGAVTTRYPVKRDLHRSKFWLVSSKLPYMTHDNTSQSYEQLFNVPKEHRLTLTSHRQVKQNSTMFETRWLDEHDEQENLVARFRAWTNQSLKPPYRKQRGWERFALSGELLDREVRYSKRPTNGYLH